MTSGKISILSADPDFLTRKGIELFIRENIDFKLIGSVVNVQDLNDKLNLVHPQVVITNYNRFQEGVEILKQIRKMAPKTGILVVTGPKNSAEISSALESGATSFLLTECDEEEMREAIYKTAQSQRFLCGKVLAQLTNHRIGDVETSISCTGLNVTEREVEIIRHVAEGFSNKEIAEKLFLSTHTVNTHRKNIMYKLEVNNTAGLVLFAVRNNLLGPNKFLFS